MAVTINTVFAGLDSFTADVIASADADTTATINHGISGGPTEVYATWFGPSAQLSLWNITGLGSTQVVFTKSTTAGSGNAGTQLRVVCKRPHSIGR